MVVAGGLSACDDPAPSTLDCPTDGPFTIESSRVQGTVVFTEPTEPLTRGDSLDVRGTTLHDDDLAIREVLVGGVSATKSEFNFKSWNATLSYDDLINSSQLGDDGKVTVSVDAIDACGNRYPFGQLVVDVDTTPNVAITSLELTVTYPEGKTSLPANGDAAAVITVTGMGRADTAVVSLDASAGRFQGVETGDNVTLNAVSAEADASATALFYADADGDLVITATVDNIVATAIVVAAGAPTVAPGRATLTPGGSVELTVIGRGEVDYCQASSAEYLTVSHEGAALGAAPTNVTRSADGTYRLTVAADSNADEAGAVTVTCVDTYGQFNESVIDLVIPAQTGTSLDALSLVAELPGNNAYLPADGSASAVLNITASGNTGDTPTVALAASSGNFTGGVSDDTVTLANTDPATAIALYTPDTPGTVVITVTAGGLSAATTIEVAGPPVIAPTGAALLPGSSIDVVVLTEGVISTCQATASASFDVSTGGTPVDAVPTDVQAPAFGPLEVTIFALDTGTPGETTSLTCIDSYGQLSTATFVVSP